MSLPVVALVGRPNVGKSALFNRIVGRNTAIVSEEAGTTRDRHFGQAEWAGSAFWLVDTGGITDDPRAAMDVEIRRQVQQAIAEADLLLFVVDARAGLHPVDHRIAEILRTSGKPFLVIANKVDNPRTTDFYEFYELGARPHPGLGVSGSSRATCSTRWSSTSPRSRRKTTPRSRSPSSGAPTWGSRRS